MSETVATPLELRALVTTNAEGIEIIARRLKENARSGNVRLKHEDVLAYFEKIGMTARIMKEHLERTARVYGSGQ